MASRFEFSAELRSRGDFYRANNVFSAGTPLGMTGMDPATGMPIFGGVSKGDQENDTILTNRLRLNMRAKATENLEFVGRLAMYKAWGMQSTPTGLADGYPIFDGNTSRTPNDSALYVDRAYINWTEIAGLPIWLSVGRRPTTDGPPAQLRMNSDSRLATPVAYMDYPFDGFTLGYAYEWGIEALGNGRIRFCYGRGFENGLLWDRTEVSAVQTDLPIIARQEHMPLWHLPGDDFRRQLLHVLFEEHQVVSTKQLGLPSRWRGALGW